MSFQVVEPSQREDFNRVVSHPLQSYEWGEFREKTGVKVVRRGLFDPSTHSLRSVQASSPRLNRGSGKNKLVDAFQLTLHPIPHTPFTIGYLPKGSMPNKELIEELRRIGKEEKCIFIQLEPNVVRRIYKNEKGHLDTDNPETMRHARDDRELEKLGLLQSAHPLFTKYTFVLDLTKSEEELLTNMHSKTRYNIRVAQKHGVIVGIEDSKEAFGEYLKLTRETTTRQKFYAHTEKYHKTQWDTLGSQMANGKPARNASQSDAGGWQMDKLTSQLLLGKLEKEVLVAWILFTFRDGLYYPYGASSSTHREAMASNLIMFEAIKFGRERGLKYFDMWGALGPIPDSSDSWFGFHRFKLGYGADLHEMIGSYDLVIHPALYQFYKLSDKLRWFYLRLRK
jgi:lipid II:glycine glycyltransferase (peptidoglycan interpeptide bridge formation enzyme)